MSAGIDEPDGSFTMRFQAFAVRLLPPDIVFGQLLNAFDVCNNTDIVVGVNIVGQENAAVSLSDFWLHMRFMRFVWICNPPGILEIILIQVGSGKPEFPSNPKLRGQFPRLPTSLQVTPCLHSGQSPVTIC